MCVDIDDDLWSKAKVKGPVVGRKANLEAATKFSLADPQDTDGNTMYKAVKTYDELKKEGHTVEIVTLTGHRDLGYKANSEISRQLEQVLDDFKAEAAIFVSDGASDEQVLPMVQSRIKINSVETVTVKQSKELEKTYFVILEKLKEPHYARLFFGIPGLLVILYFFFGDLGLRLFLGVFGAYLILKGFGVEEKIAARISRADLSLGRLSFIFYFAAFALLLASVYLGISSIGELQPSSNYAKVGAYALKDFMLLFPVSILLIVAASVSDSLGERKTFQLPSHAVSAVAIVLLTITANNLADWVIGTLSFSDLFYSLIFMTVTMYLVIYLAKEFKAGIISRMKLTGKEVYTEIGGFLGKVEKFDKKSELFIIETKAGQRLDFDSAHVSNIGEKLIIKY